MIMHHKNLDYERHCQYQIGEFVQAHEEPNHINTNTRQQEHWTASIFYRWKMPKEGTNYYIYKTNKFVKSRKLTKVPITPSIIKQVHVLAELDDMPGGLKITN
jgi:hypothetical protein